MAQRLMRKKPMVRNLKSSGKGISKFSTSGTTEQKKPRVCVACGIKKIGQSFYKDDVVCMLCERNASRELCEPGSLFDLIRENSSNDGRVADQNFYPPKPNQPTNSLPGTDHRIEVYAQRVIRGEDIFHEDDLDNWVGCDGSLLPYIRE